MKDYNIELNHYEYNKKYKVPNEHKWDSLKNEEEVKKFEKYEHENQTYEIDEDVFKTAKELLTPNKEDIKQSSPEITGQYEANPSQLSE